MKLCLTYHLIGFDRKCMRGKLAIGITANFVNNNTKDEALIQELGAFSFAYKQDFFKKMRETTGIDLENFTYYKDETHYFVMTAKKQSLLNKGVLKEASGQF